jgi:hypothetical protein
VLLEACTGYPSQQWRPVYPRSVSPSANAAALALYNPQYQMCLSDPGSSTTNGTAQVVWPCNGNRNQEWTPPQGRIASGIPGKCVDDSGNLTANGNKIDLSACNGTAAQRWVVRTDATVRIHGKCLDVRGGGTAIGTLVDLYSCNGTGAQQWRLVSGGGGATLENPHSGLCLTDPGDSTVNGTQLQIRGCTSSDPGRVWRVF